MRVGITILAVLLLACLAPVSDAAASPSFGFAEGPPGGERPLRLAELPARTYADFGFRPALAAPLSIEVIRPVGAIVIPTCRDGTCRSRTSVIRVRTRAGAPAVEVVEEPCPEPRTVVVRRVVRTYPSVRTVRYLDSCDPWPYGSCQTTCPPPVVRPVYRTPCPTGWPCGSGCDPCGSLVAGAAAAAAVAIPLLALASCFCW